MSCERGGGGRGSGRGLQRSAPSRSSAGAYGEARGTQLCALNSLCSSAAAFAAGKPQGAQCYSPPVTRALPCHRWPFGREVRRKPLPTTLADLHLSRMPPAPSSENSREEAWV